MKALVQFFPFLTYLVLFAANAPAQISGEMDTTFRVSRSWGPDKADQSCSYSQHMPDGTWIVSGDFTRFSGHPTRNIARLHANGEVDTSFTFTSPIYFLKYLTLCPDGSYLGIAVTLYLDCSEFGGAFVRFDHSGQVLPQIPYQIPGSFPYHVNFIHTYSDGKFLFKAGNVVCRNNPDGSLDTTFLVLEDVVRRPLVLPDGKFLVIRSDQKLHRHKANGQEDSTFVCPVEILVLNLDYDVNNIYLDLQGRILVSGYPFVRLHLNGAVDSTFLQSSSGAEIFKIDSNWIYTANLFNHASQAPVVLKRHNHSGRQDSSYAIRLCAAAGLKYGLRPRGDGWAMLGFCSINEAYYNFQMAFLDSTGNRIPPPGLEGFDGDIRRIKVLPDGKILALGDFNFFSNHPISNIARLLPDGNLDTSFHSPFRQGNIVLDGESPFRDISVGINRKILLCGNFKTIGTTPVQQVVMLHPNGTLDTQFALDVNGLTTDTSWYISNAFIGENQKIYVKFDLSFTVGTWEKGGKSIVFRANLDGSRDTTFAPRRYLNQNYFNSMHRGRNGSFYMENSCEGNWWDGFEPPSPYSFCKVWSSLKIDSAGNLAPGLPQFGGSSLYTRYEPGVDRITEMLDGTVIISGHCRTSGSWFTRYNSNGPSKDYSDQGEIFFYSDKPGIDFGDIFLTPDSGFIYCGNGRNLLRLDRHNNLDENFSNPAFYGGIVTCMGPFDSNGFYVAGTFNSIEGKLVNRIARLRLYPPVVTSTKILEQAETVVVYPNPTKDLIHLKLPEGLEQADIHIIDFQGRTVLEANAFWADAGISVQSLRPGIYLLQVQNGSRLYCTKWVKE